MKSSSLSLSFLSQNRPSVSSREPVVWWFPVTPRTRTTFPGTATSRATTTCCLSARAPLTATASPCTATAPHCPAAPPAHCSRPASTKTGRWTSAPISSRTRKLNFFFFLLNHWVQMNIHRTQGDVLFEPLFIYLCVCVCERGESLVHAAIRLLHCCLIFYHCIISKLFWAVSVPVNTTYLCCIVNSRSSTKISLEGIYTFVCTQVYLFFWYADLFVFFDTSQVRRWKVEDDRRRKAKWLSYSCKFFLSETVS